MYSFLLPLLIILSLAGVLVLVVRRTPELKQLKSAGRTLMKFVTDRGKQLWQFTLEVKDVSAPGIKQIPRSVSKAFLKGTAFARSHLQKAEQLLASGETEKAEQHFIKVIQKDPKDEQAYLGLGKLYLNEKKYPEAIEVYRFLTKLKSENDTYHANLGQALFGKKRFKRARRAYERAVELRPENPKRYVNLGMVLDALDDSDEALAQYEKAHKLQPENPQFMIVLAEALAERDRTEEAVEFLEEALKIEPTNHVARERLMKLKF